MTLTLYKKVKNKGVISVFLVLISFGIKAKDFKELILEIQNNEFLQAQFEQANAFKAKAQADGSFGDPKLSIAAINLPQSSLSHNESMMTGYQFTLSQNLSLSGKYGKLEEAVNSQAKSVKASAKQLKREYEALLWNYMIKFEELESEKKIILDNLDWVSNYLKISKRLYSTGKVPQQAVLDIQIRLSEQKSLLEQNKYNEKALRARLSTLLSYEKNLDVHLNTVPWRHLDSWNNLKSDSDYKLEALKEKLKASELKVSAMSRNYIPDITIGLSYTKRNQIDGLGDFVGASITIPLPSSDKRYAAKNETVASKRKSEFEYKHYLKTKPNSLREYKFEIENYISQLNILENESIKFAKSSRDVIAKSYSRGAADYLELLRAELQYQKQLLKKIILNSQLKTKKVQYLLVKGSELTPWSQK